MIALLFTIFNSKLKKDSREFEQNTLQHMDYLYNYAFNLTGTRSAANALLQETYLKAFKFWEYLEKYDSYKSWLLRIMKNSYNAAKTKKNNNPENLTYDEVQNIYEKIRPANVDDPGLQKKNYENLTDTKLSVLISSLPEDFRIVLILCDIMGYSYEEIADFVDVPVGTVCSRIDRGRKMLFSKLIIKQK